MRYPAILGVCLAATVPLLAQQREPAQEVFEGAIEVRVVNVDVSVLDAHGKSVPGLRREDFQLFEDGERVEISNFEEIGDGRSSLLEAKDTQPGAAPPSPAPGAQGLSLVVFVDNFNIRPFGRNKVVRQVSDFLAKLLKPEDRVLIATYDLGLKIRRSFSDQARPLEEDLKGLSKLATRGPIADSAKREVLRYIQEVGCTTEAGEQAKSYARQARSDAVNTLSALYRFTESLAGLPGKKAILFVSDGFPLQPGLDVLDYLGKVCGSTSSAVFDAEDVTSELRKVTSAANAGRVSFYTLEAAGLRGFSSVSVEAANAFETPTMDFMANANVQDSLFNMASETGGRAILNSNDLKDHLAEISKDLRNYYSLGFSPRHRDDGKVHDLRVKVLRDGLTARTRTGFRASAREDRQVARLEATLWHGAQENPLAIRVDFGEAREDGKGLLLLPVAVMIPLANLTLLPQGEKQTGRIEILVASRDAEGRDTPAKRISLPVELASERIGSAKKIVLKHEIAMQMRKGEYVFAFAVLDDLGGTASYVQQQVVVEKPRESGKRGQ